MFKHALKIALLAVCLLQPVAAAQAEDGITGFVLSQVADMMNADNPKMVNETTRLERVASEPGPRLVYYYTMLDVSVGSPVLGQARHDLPDYIRGTTCASDQVRMLLKAGVAIGFVYQGVDGVSIANVSVSDAICRG